MYVIITDLTISLVIYHVWVISPRNSTLFTRLFLTGRHAQAGHETNVNSGLRLITHPLMKKTVW